MRQQGTEIGAATVLQRARRTRPRKGATQRSSSGRTKPTRPSRKTRSQKSTAPVQSLKKRASLLIEREQQEHASLPNSYGVTRLVVLPVNPTLIHAYWEVTAKDLQTGIERLGTPRKHLQSVLRFYTTPSSRLRAMSAPQEPFDVEIDLKTRNWYVHKLSPGSCYLVELGLKSRSGQFVPLVAGVLVQTPPSEPSQEEGHLYMRVSASGATKELISLSSNKEQHPPVALPTHQGQIAHQQPWETLNQQLSHATISLSLKNNVSVPSFDTHIESIVSSKDLTAPSTDTSGIDLTKETEEAFVAGISSGHKNV